MFPRPAPLALLFSALAVLAPPETARAQSFERGDGATRTGLAGAATAAVADPTALWDNPANLVFSKTRIALGMALLSDATTATEPDQPQTRGVEAPLLAPHVALLLPLAGRRVWVAFGYRLGWQQSLGYAASAEATPAGEAPGCEQRLPAQRFLGRAHRSSEHTVSAAIALRRGWLGVGAALEAGLARLSGARELFAGSAADLPKLDTDCRDLEARWRLSGLSIGGRFGVTVQPAWWLRIAFSAHLPQVLTLSGSVSLDASPIPPSGWSRTKTTNGSGEVTVVLPAQLSLAVSSNLSADLRLHAELGLRFAGRDATSLAIADARIVLEGPSGSTERSVDSLPLIPGRRAALRGHLGLEWRLLDGLVVLRGGWAFIASTFDAAETPSSALLDLARHRVGAGVTIGLGRFRLALAASHTFERDLDLAPQVPLNPIAPTATRPSGAGTRLTWARTRVVAEIQARF